MKLLHTTFCASILLGLSFVNPSIAATTVTVDVASTKQTIRGFGGMNHRIWTGYDLNTSDRNLAFGNGAGQMGLTVLRIWVSDKESDWALELPTAKDVVSRGGIVYASPWSPPTALRTPYSFLRWGTTYNSYKVSSTNYAAYVTHLNKFAKYMKDNGAPLYAISIQNEPDWCDAWTCWSADEVYNFTKALAADLRQQGTKVITAESFSYAKGYYDKILNDASALSNIDIIGAHFYGSGANSADNFFQYPLADQKAASKERWMTEHYTDSKGNANMWRGYIITGDQDQTPTYDTVRALDVAYEIHRAMVEGNFNQYTWWYIRRNYGLIMNDATANVNPAPVAADAGKVSKRGYCIAQFAKFVRPGFVRITATKNPDVNVYVSAFKKADSVVVVVVNRNKDAQKALSFSVPGATNITSWKKYTTSETKSVADDGSVTATGGNFSTTVDKESITTLVGVAPGTQSSSSSVSPLSSSVAPSSSSAIAQAAYSSAVSIPGILQAENYDIGGEGVAYHDADAVNSGNLYRTDGVDVTGDATSGYKIGWTIAGEWLEYTVNVPVAGSYKWEARVSSGGDSASFHVLIDDANSSGIVKVPNTGDWNTYATVTGPATTLTAGKHVVRIVIDGSYGNIDWITFGDASIPVKIDVKQNMQNVAGEYTVFNMMGASIGQVTLTSSHSILGQLAKLTSKPGLYVLRSIHGSKTYQIDYRN